MPPIHYLVLLALLPLSTALHAIEYEPLQSIRDAAENQALEIASERDNVVVRVGRLDRRLKLRRCAEALETAPGPGKRRIGRVSISVRCNAPKPWSLYVPVSISQRLRVVVASHPLERGDILRDDDLGYRELELKHAAHHFFTDKQRLIGRQVSRRIAADAPIRSNQTRRPTAIERGARISILSSTPGLRVRMAGKALDKGSVGDVIRVRNASSGRELDARVLSPGVVRVHH